MGEATDERMRTVERWSNDVLIFTYVYIVVASSPSPFVPIYGNHQKLQYGNAISSPGAPKISCLVSACIDTDKAYELRIQALYPKYISMQVLFDVNVSSK